jgi:hypothetical protein
MRAELGDKVKSLVTGHEGVVVGVSNWLNGCRTCGVQAPIKKKGDKVEDAEWVDDSQLKVIQKRAIKIKKRPIGGPQPTPRMQISPGKAR